MEKKYVKKGKKYTRYKKYGGIAYIPTAKCSYFCKDMFNVVESEATLARCKYSLEKDRWIPYEHIVDRKLPDKYDDIKKSITAEK